MASSRKCLQPRLRSRFARLPARAQAARPVRRGRLQLPILQPVARDTRGRDKRVGAGSGFGGSPSDSTRFQNGVNTRRPRPSLLRMVSGAASRSPGCGGRRCRWSASAAASSAATARAGAMAMSLKYTASALVWRASFGDDRRGRATAQDQRGAALAEAPLQAAQRLRQPPARRAAERTNPWAAFVEHIDAEHRSAAACRRGQGRVVGKPQIVAKPDQRWAGRGDCHRSTATGSRQGCTRFLPDGRCNRGRYCA